MRRSLIAATSDAPNDIAQLSEAQYAADVFWLRSRQLNGSLHQVDVRYFLIDEAQLSEMDQWTAAWLDGLEHVAVDVHQRLSAIAMLPFYPESVAVRLETLHALANETSAL